MAAARASVVEPAGSRRVGRHPIGMIASPKAGDGKAPPVGLAVAGPAPSAPPPDMTTTALIPAAASASFTVDTGSFLAIVATSAVAATLVAVAAGRNLFALLVAGELTLGVLIGSWGAGLAKGDGQWSNAVAVVLVTEPFGPPHRWHRCGTTPTC